HLPGLGAAATGLLLGLVVSHVVSVPDALRPGVAFCSTGLLRTAVVLLGTGISFGQVIRMSGGALLIIATTLVIGMAATVLVGRALGLPLRLTTLVGIGTAICGASAIAAAAPVLRATKEETAYALATIFTFNLLALLVYPPAGHALGLSSAAFGTWAGTAIHDTSSVLAAGYAFDQQAGIQATVIKLTRTMFLVPVVVGLALVQGLRSRQERVELRVGRLVPPFVWGFALMAAANGLGLVPTPVSGALNQVAGVFIVAALSAIGLQTRLDTLRRLGAMSFALGMVASVAVALASLAWIRWLGL
ncbi:MAG: putative sulfate exporter family transporter, partial [Firmicutes bacterium]|nr:putative sulfate exporter family transporter [Bacillota bacterium]